jgi:thermostable 8-oxoguanine DNA glycosylase
MQNVNVAMGPAQLSIELPAPDAEVLPGVVWGRIECFPTPAYWAFQALARRFSFQSIQYKLGRTLREEVGACLLGGHGIPARIGLLAFEHLRAKNAFTGDSPSEEQLKAWLAEPMSLDGRQVRYRFASQKARYLVSAFRKLSEEPAPNTGRSLRDWLTGIQGVGYKTASWIARNWLDADDVAILDIHLLRAGVLAGFLDHTLTVERHYLEIEAQFLRFSQALGVRPSELDAVIWLEMAQSRSTVARMLQALPESRFKRRHSALFQRNHVRKSRATQLTLIG